MTKTSEKGDGDQNKNVGHLVALTIGVFCRVVKAEAKSDFISPNVFASLVTLPNESIL